MSILDDGGSPHGQQYLPAEDSTIAIATDHGVKPKQIVYGLDTLRFITAMWVAFSHGARFPVSRIFSPDSTLNSFFLFIGNTTWNGTAAVAVFFLISGFLIHSGNIGKRKVDIKSFLARRLIRIALPLLAIILAAFLLGHSYLILLDEILWTVYAEIIYYTLYPFILPLIYRFGIGRVLLVSLSVSLIMIAAHPREIYLWSFGLKGTWLFNAPLWLMGCFLAEHREKIGAITQKVPLWFLRCGVLFYCYASTILATHMGHISIGYTWTIWLFGAYCMVWLDAEMKRGTGRSTLKLLERFGLAGYSLYLTHVIAINLVNANLTLANLFFQWLITLFSVAIVAWSFYRIVEWPAHKLARAVGRPNRVNKIA